MSNNCVKKVNCGGCTKPIKTNHKNIFCNSCSALSHFLCSQSSGFTFFQNVAAAGPASAAWYCANCIGEYGVTRYNPFLHMEHTNFHDQSDNAELFDFQNASDCLQNCKALGTANDFNKYLQKNIKPNNQNFSVFFNNLDGNATNFDSISVELKKIGHKFSVIGLCETNIDRCHKSLYNIDGYESVYQSRLPGKSKGSGLGLYIDKRFAYEELPELSLCTPDIETLFIKLTNTNETITLGVVYRSPSGSFCNFSSVFEKLLADLPQDNVYMTGDFNINLHDSTDTHSRNFENTLLGNGLSPLISLSTHQMPHHSETCIDNIISNNFNDIIITGTIDDRVSHHAPLVLVSCTSAAWLNSSNEDDGCDPIVRYRYDFSPSNLAELDVKVVDLVNNHLKEQEKTEKDFEEFMKTFADEVDNTCKVEIESASSKRNSFDNPWITPGIIVSSNKKHDMHKSWKKSKENKNDPHDKGDINLYNNLSRYRKKLKYIIRNAKDNYYKNKIDYVKGDPKATWKLINNLRGNTKSSISPTFIIDSEVVLNHRRIANAFNDYFVSVAQKLNDHGTGIFVDPLPSFRSFMSKRTNNSIVMHDCTAEEIREIIKSFSNGKSSDIPIQAVKSCHDILSVALSRFFNNFMRIGIFPDVLKIGKVTPIYKSKGNKQYFDNYRPISILPIFGKIFEKIMYTRIYNFLISNNLMYSKQFGFRKGHSTSHALNFSIAHLTKEIASKKHCIGIFIDLSKAFDTIDHNIMLEKLDCYGIRGTAHDLISSYLTSRKQCTKFMDEVSDLKMVLYGVPQGSVLGPLLFLVYINDIVNCCSLGEFILYADDTNIFVAGDTKDEVYMKANQILGFVQKFMASNLLHINLSKCFYMYFKPNIHSRNSCIRAEGYNSDHRLLINGQKVKQVSTIKFLGVVIDENLTWLPQIEGLRKKLLMCLGTLYRVRTSIPKRLYKSIYHALFESHLTYGISVWGAQSQSVLNDLFTMQKKCLRILFGKNNVNSANCFCFCNYGESGTMINCSKCDEWFHDECLGLSEADVNNIDIFHCPKCIENDRTLQISFHVNQPLPQKGVTFCHCGEPENGFMIECYKCNNWYHDLCLGATKSDMNKILLYFCKSCRDSDCRGSLKIIYKDYTKEHTKPLFKSNKILTVHSLYVYHTVIELYKILKFRTPYCLFEMICPPGANNMDLNLKVTPVSLQCQRMSFLYQAVMLWNRFYKRLITPFTIPVHHSYISRHNLTQAESIHYDYSTKVATLKSKLLVLVFETQVAGDCSSWQSINHTFIQ